jgi:hypothetical protein
VRRAPALRSSRHAVALLLALCTVAATAAAAGGARADLDLPALDIAKLPYHPQPNLDDLDDWQTFNAYNVVHYVSHELPARQPDDASETDEPGDVLANHQLEFLDWYERAMGRALEDFGVTFRRYTFTSPGSVKANFSQRAGRAIDLLAIVPGADHPEDIVVIGSHFDQVDGSPMAAWDETSGTGVIVRTAAMLADYWRATGTRPSRTYAFAAWDAEEPGGFGSATWVRDQLPRDPNALLTAYINHDPCGATYPAMYRGSPVSRNPVIEPSGFIPLDLSLHPPGGGAFARARMAAFNASVPGLVHDLFERIDDTLPLAPLQGSVQSIPVFVSTGEAAALGVPDQESVVRVRTDSLVLFRSDAEKFPGSVPVLNPGPDVAAPHDWTVEPGWIGWSSDALAWFHTPMDNFEELVRYTSPDQTGLTYSKGLAMSWEFCAALSAWTMLQPSQGGAQTATTDPVAFFEATRPNSLTGSHTFDASGSYAYTDVASRARRAGNDLGYAWSFGDGTTASGRTVTKTFAGSTKRTVTLTVTDPVTGRTDSMSLRIG